MYIHVYICVCVCVCYINCTNYRQCLPWPHLVPYTDTTCVVTVMLLTCAVYRITNTNTFTHTPATVHCPLIFLRVGSTAMIRRSRDDLLSATADTHSVRAERKCICIRKYVSNDSEGVQFLCEFEPYGPVQMELLCNKIFYPWMVSKRLSWMFVYKAVSTALRCAVPWWGHISGIYRLSTGTSRIT